jgi:2'-5' RNA ligase
VTGDARIRLFCALQLPPAAVAELATWQREHLSGRVVPPRNLHVTLAFLGPRPVPEVSTIAAALAEAARAGGPFELRPSRYRETGRLAMIVCEDPAGAAGRLAADVQARLERPPPTAGRPGPGFRTSPSSASRSGKESPRR